MDRISELTRIARERDLTPDEQAERKALREEYIADWRRSTIDVLENTYIDHGDGCGRGRRSPSGCSGGWRWRAAQRRAR